jgi:hypothetical protein
MKRVDLMARRKFKRRAPRKYKSAINLLAAAEGTFYASQATKALFGMNAMPWLMEGWLTPVTTRTGSGTSVVYGAGNWDKISLKELIEMAIPGGATGGTYPAQGMTFTRAVSENLAREAPRALLNSMVGGVAFRLLKGVSARPRRFVNKGIRSLGMGNVVKV